MPAAAWSHRPVFFGNPDSPELRSRLLPASVPFRFFGTAAVFHCLAWLALYAASDAVSQQSGGLGPGIAALHLFTLGVLVMTAIGASLQLLPIATRQPVASITAAKAVWWLLAPGVALLAAGMGIGPLPLAYAGAAAVIAALAVYAWLLGNNLAHARGMPLVVAHGWAALACLAGLAVSGYTLVAHHGMGFLPDLRGAAILHLTLAAYGFMGMLVLGLSDLLIPMLAISPAPAKDGGYAVLGGCAAAIVLTVVFALAGAPRIAYAFSALVGAAASLVHVVRLARCLRRRHGRAQRRWLLLVFASWAMLPASLLAAAALALDAPVPRLPALFAALLVPGWLLTLLLGVLQRIAPFLASVHASGRARSAPLPSALTADGPLNAHAACHFAALGLLAAGIAADRGELIAVGAVAGAAGAVAFAAFLAVLFLRLRRLAPASAG